MGPPEHPAPAARRPSATRRSWPPRRTVEAGRGHVWGGGAPEGPGLSVPWAWGWGGTPAIPPGTRVAGWPPLPDRASQASVAARPPRAASVWGGRQARFPPGWGLGLRSAHSQGRALPLAPPPRAPSTCSSPAGTAGREPLPGALRAPEDRALAGVRTVTEAAARPGVGSLFIPGCGAGASVTPTLWMGTPRPSGRRELARSQGSEAAEPGGPGLACRLPTGLHSAARPRRLPGGSASSRRGPW